MNLKVSLKLASGERRVVKPESRESIDAPASGDCPECGGALRVTGKNKRIAADDRAYEADAHCVACGALIGVLRQETNTLFGLREDEAIARMGIRIY